MDDKPDWKQTPQCMAAYIMDQNMEVWIELLLRKDSTEPVPISHVNNCEDCNDVLTRLAEWGGRLATRIAAQKN